MGGGKRAGGSPNPRRRSFGSQSRIRLARDGGRGPGWTQRRPGRVRVPVPRFPGILLQRAATRNGLEREGDGPVWSRRSRRLVAKKSPMIQSSTGRTRAEGGCPDIGAIETIAAGRAAEASERLHLGSCGACLATLEELRAQARTHARLRTALAPPDGGSGGVDRPEDLIPGYTLMAEIGRGSQGIVYKAVQGRTKRTVAVKMLLGGAFATERQRARFEREVEIVAGLNHPGIVTIYDRTPVRGGRYAYAMEYIEGAALDDWIPPGQDLRDRRDATLRLFILICNAVQYAHQNGVMHRDLKPANILVDRAGAPHILDFGIAKALGAGPGAPTATLTEEFAGTLMFASPEQVAGNPDGIDSRTDVYTLGVLLYRLICGRHPYPVGGASLDLAARIRTQSPTPPRAIDASIPPDLSTVILHALHKAPGERYQSPGDLGRDLERCLAGKPIEARRDSLGYVLRKHVQRHRFGVAFACTLLVMLVAGLAVSLAFWRRAVAAQAGLEDALDRADQREKDIRQVADAQATMLSGVDPETMGTRLREDVVAEARAALGRSHADAEELAARVEQLDALLSGTNFTNVGTRGIDHVILAPALAAVERDYAGQPLVQAALWQTVADVYQRLGLYDAAVPPLERAIDTRRRELGDKHKDTLESLYAMGFLLTRYTTRADAKLYVREALYGQREALAKRRRELGDGDPETLKAMVSMADALGDVYKITEAEAYARHAMELHRRALGDAHPDTLKAISLRGAILWYQGRLSEAEPYSREAMEGRRRVLGDLHPDTLLSINNMGLLLTSAGRFAEAEAFHREALTGRRRVPGNDKSHMHATILSNMVLVLKPQGKLREAEQYAHEVVEHHRRVSGDLHLDTLWALLTLGELMVRQGRCAEAEPYCRRAYDNFRRVGGEQYSVTIRALSVMGRLQHGIGRLDEAEKFGAEAVRRGGSSFPSGHWFHFEILMHHARTLVAMGCFEQAEEELTEAHKILAMGMRLRAPGIDTTTGHSDLVGAFADLYAAWHEAEPTLGHDAAGAEWKATLDAMTTPAPAQSNRTP